MAGSSTRQMSKRVQRRAPVSRLTPERRIADILAAARALLAERGYENCIIADIADRAGVVEGTIYRYFENKRDLFIKLAESCFEELLREPVPPVDISGSRNRLRYAIRRALTIIRSEPALTRFVLMELRPDPSYKSLRLYRLNRAFTEGVTRILQEAGEAGEVDQAIPLRLLRDMIFGGIEHQTWAFLRNEGDFSTDATADGLTTVIYRGMQANAPAEITEASVPGALLRLEVKIDTLLDHARKGG